MATNAAHNLWETGGSPCAARERLPRGLSLLLDHWVAIRPPGRLPGRQHFDPMAVAPVLSHLWLLDVIDGGIDFCVRVRGGEVESAWPRSGASLPKALAPEEAAPLCHALRKVVTTGAPQWLEAKYTTRAGVSVGVEHLALPLARDGAQVDMVLGASAFGWERARTQLRAVETTIQG